MFNVVKKKLYASIIMTFALTILAMSSVFGVTNVYFSDDFESYEENAQINNANSSYTIKYDGTGAGNQKIISAEQEDGTTGNILQLQGASSWASDVRHSFTIDDKQFIILEADINPVSGTTPGDISFGSSGAPGSWAKCVCRFGFENGKLRIGTGDSTSLIDTDLTYSNGNWYKIKLVLDRTNNLYYINLDGTFINQEGYSAYSAAPEWISLGAGNNGTNTMYYDNVRVYSSDTVDLPSTYTVTLLSNVPSCQIEYDLRGYNSGDTLEFEAGTEVRLYGKAKCDYEFDEATSSEVTLETGGSICRYFTMPEEDVTVTFNFKPLTPEGTITLPTFDDVDYGFEEIASKNIGVSITHNSTLDPVRLFFEQSGEGSGDFEITNRTGGVWSGIGSWDNKFSIKPKTSLSAGTHTATITLKYTKVNDEVVTIDSKDISFTVVPTTYTINVNAVDKVDSEALENAKISLLKEDSAIDSWASDFSTHQISGLEVGEYTLKVTEAPEGYLTPSDITFTIESDGTITTTATTTTDESGNKTFIFEFVKTKIEVKAVKETDSSALASVKIQILDSESTVRESWISTTENHSVEGLITGKEYIIKITEVPTGYEIPENITFTIATDGIVTSTGNMTTDGILLVTISEITVTEITEAEATSNIIEIAVWDKEVTRPTFTMTKGLPAYVPSASGYWLKKENENWNPVFDGKFTVGLWKYKTQLSVQGDDAKTNKILETTSFKVDGENWSNLAEYGIDKNYSYNYYESAEIEITEITPTAYTVAYDVNGGTVHGGELTTRTVASGDTFTITKLFQMPDKDYHITVHAPEDKWFDAFEVNGERYEEGAKITITGNTVIKYLWKDITYVDKVELTIEAPAAGTKIEGEYDEVLKHIAHESINVRPEITLPEGADYTIESVETYWAASGDYNPYVGEIEAGKTYNAVVYVYCEDDSYQFLEEGLEVVVNGEKITTFGSQGFWVTVEYPMESVSQYLLKANVGEGVGNISVVPSGDEPDFEYPTTSVAYKENAGTKWLLAAKSNEDYRFVNWTKSGDDTFTDTNSQITIELTEDVEYLANFELIEYNVTYDVNGGTGTMSGETSKYYIFPSCDFTAPTGKTFDKWEVNGKTYKVGDTLTLTEDITVKAIWKNKSTSSGGGGGSSSSSYKVTTKIENGTITPANASVKKNADQEFTFKANEGYEIADVLVDGISVGTVNSYKLEKVTEKHTIEVKTVKVSSLSNVDDWAKEEMARAEEKGLIPETFSSMNATKPITRLEFVAVAVKLYEAISGKKAEPVAVNPFTDTNDEYVLKAYALGITLGTSETTFTPNAEITREQMATMLTRALNKAGINTEYDITNATKFADDSNLNDWGRPSVYFMARNEIIKGVGDNRFQAKGNAKVEEAIAVTLRSVDVFAK